jgi:MoxR-like ATPase
MASVKIGFGSNCTSPFARPSPCKLAQPGPLLFPPKGHKDRASAAGTQEMSDQTVKVPPPPSILKEASMRPAASHGLSPSSYPMSAELVEAANVAIALGKPLLVEGEDGLGKSLVGHSIADNLALPLVHVTLRHATTVKDLLYKFDDVARLRDAQLRAEFQTTSTYISFGPLGEAIKSGRRCVILLERIDKSSVDFPDDLLALLEAWSFTIDELPQDEKDISRRLTGNLAKPPIVIITSAAEKRLPRSFMIRCIYYRMPFPDTAALEEYVMKSLGIERGSDFHPVVRDIIDEFMKLRNNTASDRSLVLPSLSNLFDVISIAQMRNLSADEVRRNFEYFARTSDEGTQVGETEFRGGGQLQIMVFLCHSSGDKPFVRELFSKLESEGVKVWLDEQSLVAGQDWKLEISKAIRQSDAVVVCLSKKSISKSGFVHREIGEALEIAEEQPEGAIYIVPYRIDECEVPARLSSKHWINAFEVDGFAKLMKALRRKEQEVAARAKGL